MKHDKTGDQDFPVNDVRTASAASDNPIVATKRAALLQAFLNKLSPDDRLQKKIAWRGQAEDFFTFFVVFAHVEWKDVAEWMKIRKANLEYLRKSQFDSVTYIKRHFVENFFLSLPPAQFNAALSALDHEKRVSVFSQLATLGICDEFGIDMPRGYTTWTLENYNNLRAYLKKHKFDWAPIVPDTFEKTASKPDHLPCRIQSLVMLRLGWNMARATASAYITREEIEKRLQGKALEYFDRFTTGFWIDNHIPQNLTWGGVRHNGLIDFPQQLLGLSQRKIIKALGYKGIVDLNKDDKAIIEIDRIISLSRQLAQYLDIAQNTRHVFNVPTHRLWRKISKINDFVGHTIDVSELPRPALSILRELLPDDCQNGFSLPKYVAWGRQGSDKLHTALRLAGKKPPEQNRGTGWRWHALMRTKNVQDSALTLWLIEIAGYLATPAPSRRPPYAAAHKLTGQKARSPS